MSRYNRWANVRLFDCIGGLSEDAYFEDRGAFFGSIHLTLNHILVVDRLWTSRIAGEYHGLKGLDQVLHDDLAGLRQAREAMDDYMIRLTGRHATGLDGGLDKDILYRMIKGGEKHASPVRHILLTLFNHQTHHRGQVHCMLTQAGIKDPPPLDVIFYLREAESAD